MLLGILSMWSGQSTKAIRELELGLPKLHRVTMQASSLNLEIEGLIFIPDQNPLRGQNCRGATTAPITKPEVCATAARAIPADNAKIVCLCSAVRSLLLTSPYSWLAYRYPMLVPQVLKLLRRRFTAF